MHTFFSFVRSCLSKLSVGSVGWSWQTTKGQVINSGPFPTYSKVDRDSFVINRYGIIHGLVFVQVLLTPRNMVVWTKKINWTVCDISPRSWRRRRIQVRNVKNRAQTAGPPTWRRIDWMRARAVWQRITACQVQYLSQVPECFPLLKVFPLPFVDPMNLNLPADLTVCIHFIPRTFAYLFN